MDKVNISEYDVNWVKNYETEKMKIVHAISDILLGIEHIGSTSVPGLGAKPIIDIMVGVEHLSRLSLEQDRRLLELGYEYVKKANFPERRFYRRGDWGAGTHHLHIYTYNGFNWKNNIFFRNYLINNPIAKNEYYELKKRLAAQYMDNRAAYTDAKAPFIQGILDKLECFEH